MKEKKYSLNTFWDGRAIDSKTKLSRIMLTIKLNGQKQFRISLKVRSTRQDYVKAISTQRNVSEEVNNIRKDLNEYLQKAENILERLDNPIQETFTRLFKSESDLFLRNKTEIAPFFELKIARFFKEEKFSSSSSYKLAFASLTKYKSRPHFEDINDKWLKDYQSFMLAKGCSITTPNIYLRNLRTIFNEAIKDGIISPKYYPFKGFKFGARVKSKGVLYPHELKMLLNYKTEGIREGRAKAWFFFCYLCNGMNFKDAGLLQFKNIQGNVLTFIRHKTRNTLSEQKEIKVYLHDLAIEIIRVWGNKSTNPDDYVFGLVDNKMSAFQKQKTLNRYKKISNQSLSKIGRELNFPHHLCLNLARHSFATFHKILGTPTSFISDALGHANSATTEHYLKQLPTEQLQAMSSKLISF
jgi:integrase